jgi:hypothetical protein
MASFKRKLGAIKKAIESRRERLRQELEYHKVLSFVPKKFWQNVPLMLIEKNGIALELVGDDYVDTAKVKKIVIHLSQPVVLSNFLQQYEEKSLVDAIYYTLIANGVREKPKITEELMEEAVRHAMLLLAKQSVNQLEQLVERLKELQQ